ncbi:class I SAM-dependent methyltransferase [Aliifodinibius sp. S!AR15-10]|uniref:class I SAM-dependent methyltransferase n=1 Tax=Aliifodinibius sp. S!AR15-10 TaxID=2950437 RepID=UPI00285FD499|nr:class I SAM-dependent methyltransferase [Aliifodinibius sp. S!AR15-10]MDR8389838.1 class I SAM-dependent methyltransferase [Aliifodinibius sp. S!AR15-10]
MIRSSEVKIGQSTLLDVGSGIGAIQYELFGDGLTRATNVEASTPYLETSKQETRRRKLTDRTSYHYGDIVELAPELSNATIVTLDKVICCYPDPEALIEATSTKATQLYGVVYPRVRFITKIGLKLGNLWSRLWNNDFRMYLFARNYIDRIIRDQGFVIQNQDQTFLWHISLYSRNGEPFI